MKTKFFWIMTVVLCGIAFQMVACSEKDDKAKVGDGTAAKTKAQKELETLQKAGDTDEEVALQLSLLKQSHRVFREAWKIIQKQKQNVSGVENPFNEAYVKLATQFAEDGKRLDKAVCPQIDVQTLSSTSKDLVAIDCKSKAKKRFLHFEITGPHTRVWKMKPSELKNGFNLTLSMLDVAAECKMEFEEGRKLKALDCKGLGQNLSLEQHVEFTQFEFHRNGENTKSGLMGKFRYKTFRNVSELVSDGDLIEVPVDGDIVFTEKLAQEEIDRLKAEQEAAQKKAEASKEQKQVQKVENKPEQQIAERATEPVETEPTEEELAQPILSPTQRVQAKSEAKAAKGKSFDPNGGESSNDEPVEVKEANMLAAQLGTAEKSEEQVFEEIENADQELEEEEPKYPLAVPEVGEAEQLSQPRGS